MSVQSRRPLRMLGGAHKSGNVYTGEVPYTLGGVQTAMIQSGALAPNLSLAPSAVSSGGHVLIYSGGGRLNSAFPHQFISGVAAQFYDAGAITVSGTSVSGQRIIGQLPANTFDVAGTLNSIREPYSWHVPFFSGLCVSCPSGAAGFTVTYSPELDPAGADNL